MIFQTLSHLILLDNLYLQEPRLIRFYLDFDFSVCLDYTKINTQLSSLMSSFNDSLTIKPRHTYSFTTNDEFYGSATQDFSSQLNHLQTVYHYSIPTVKLFYPEPFIAAPSFMHSDLWFVHILVYQYWLWFVFIFIIVFFIITFLCIIRWCNMRTKPRRETRGVSRSKCGDLITAIVPVSWAASIIISESTDAIDYFDGFGTTEMVIGIRAYQWGWEYYYPKDIDLNYNVKKNYSAFFGHSLKYNKTSTLNLHSNKMWKFYQNKMYDFVVTPAHLLLLPVDTVNLLNYLNFSDVGTNAFHESSLFKHTRIFSKTSGSNLLFTSNTFDSRFKLLTPLFNTDFDLQDSSLYGLKRQTNFTNSKTITNNFNTLFNLKSAIQLFKHNYNFSLDLNQTFTGKQQINFFKPIDLTKLSQPWLLAQLDSNLYLTEINNLLSKKILFSNLISKLNNDSDHKKLKNTLNKLLISSPTRVNLLHQFMFKTSITTNNSLRGSLSSVEQLFNNQNYTQKFFASFSINQIVQKFSQTPKAITNLHARQSNLNLNFILSGSLFFLKNSQYSLVPLSGQLRSEFKLKQANPAFLQKLLTSRLYYDAPTPPFLSNKATNTLLNFDVYLPAEEENTFATFQSREELSPEYIYKAFWNLYTSQTDLTWRLKNTQLFLQFHNNFYLPFFTFGQDYDFLNWQSLTYLEDCYWENLCSVYTVDDYLNFSDAVIDTITLSKLDRFFSRKHKHFAPEKYVILKPYIFDIYFNCTTNPTFVYTEETLPNLNLLSTHQFSFFSLINNAALMEESFDYSKNLHEMFYDSTSSDVAYSSPLFLLSTSNFVIDNFRTDSEDISWLNEDKLIFSTLFVHNPLNVDSLFNLLNWNVEPFKYLKKYYNYFFNSSQLSVLPLALVNYTPFWFKISDNSLFSFQKTLRFSNKIDLRATTRSVINTYNSYQKVYKPRLDENRSHAKVIDLAGISSKQPNLTAPRARLERSLGKNKNLFFQTSLFKNQLSTNFNPLYDAFTSLNYYFFDYPFLLGLKSDPSRYYWTDWFSRWGMFEVQPSSSSRYSISGVPFFNKSFDFSAEINGLLYDVETYFTRIARARRNYLPSWTHLPYFYTKNTFSATNNFFLEAFKTEKKSLFDVKNFLYLSHFYWNERSIKEDEILIFNPSHSNINTYARSNWVSNSPISTYYSLVSIILDTFTKREYLYRKLLSSKKKTYKIETWMLGNPKNPLLDDIRNVFFLTNATTFNSEYSREIYYSSLGFFNNTILNPNFLSILQTLGFNSTKLVSLINQPSSTFSEDPLKSQYKPMRRGIINMIRLHGTGAVAMPIEIRLQVLASSKDVIHSWAIPSAGVKIDCVPGYSSHRVIIFLVSGIFWGQCMEVCGRYHHWMPVIVYFMKRDLFFLWCTHFVFLSGSNNMWTINDRQYTNYSRTTSFNKNTWINELK